MQDEVHADVNTKRGVFVMASSTINGDNVQANGFQVLRAGVPLSTFVKHFLKQRFDTSANVIAIEYTPSHIVATAILPDGHVNWSFMCHPKSHFTNAVLADALTLTELIRDNEQINEMRRD